MPNWIFCTIKFWNFVLFIEWKLAGRRSPLIPHQSAVQQSGVSLIVSSDHYSLQMVNLGRWEGICKWLQNSGSHRCTGRNEQWYSSLKYQTLLHHTALSFPSHFLFDVILRPVMYWTVVYCCTAVLQRPQHCRARPGALSNDTDHHCPAQTSFGRGWSKERSDCQSDQIARGARPTAGQLGHKREAAAGERNPYFILLVVRTTLWNLSKVILKIFLLDWFNRLK